MTVTVCELIDRSRQSKTLAEVALRTAEERQETEKQDKEVCQAKLQELDVAMQQLQAQLDALAPEHAQRQQALAAKTEELEACQRRMDTLYAKQSRGKRFHTVAERNEYLNGVVERLNSDIDTKQSQLQAIQAEVAAEQAAVAEADATIARQRTQLETKTNQLKHIVGLLKSKGDERNQIMESKQDVCVHISPCCAVLC